MKREPVRVFHGLPKSTMLPFSPPSFRWSYPIHISVRMIPQNRRRHNNFTIISTTKQIFDVDATLCLSQHFFLGGFVVEDASTENKWIIVWRGTSDFLPVVHPKNTSSHSPSSTGLVSLYSYLCENSQDHKLHMWWKQFIPLSLLLDHFTLDPSYIIFALLGIIDG